MDDIGMIGFALGGLPQFEGNGGNSAVVEPYFHLDCTQAELEEALERLKRSELPEDEILRRVTDAETAADRKAAACIAFGGGGGITDDKSQQEREAFAKLAKFAKKCRNEAAAKAYSTQINGVLEGLGFETLSPDKVAELVFYVVEHQTDRWTELFDFLASEVAALLLEAVVAVNDIADDTSSVTQA